MAFAAFKEILRFRKLSGLNLPNLDHLHIPQNIVNAGVTPRQCLAHLYLLEQFASVKAKIDKWAEFNQLSPESIWKFYVNMAVRRMQRWFLKSFRADLRQAIPPLDVLMAWYALLQSPQDHDFFIQSTGANIESFNLELLLSVLEKTTPRDFQLPGKLHNIVKDIFPFPDLLELLDHCTSFLQSGRPEKITDELVHMFFRKERAHRFASRFGYISFRFDFHSAIDSQLEFANRILQHSWHRMYPPNQGEGLQLRAFIDRYNKFMSLVQFSSDIQDLEMCMRRPGSFIPTLDIDLVWRTHMLCPREFRLLSQRTSGIIQHTPSPRHATSYDQRASKFYKHVFGDEYVICLCWPCVHSRDVRSFPPPSWTAKPTFEEELSQELIRRGTSIIETPLSFGVRQCQKCGSHPNRRCKEKDALKGDEVQILPAVHIECVRRRRTIRDRTMAQLAQSPWAQLALGCSVSH